MGLAFTQRACKPCRTAANEVAFLSQKTRTAIIAWIWDARVLCERARKNMAGTSEKKIINFPLDIKRLHGHTYYHPTPQSIFTTPLTQNDMNEQAPFCNFFSNRNKLHENISVGWCL